MRSRVAKGFIAVILIIIVILTGLYLFALRELKSQISDMLVQEMNATPAPDVQIRTSPLGFATGHFDEIKIAARTVSPNGVMINDLNISMTGIDVDILESLNGELAIEKQGQTKVDFIATENSINNVVPVFAEITLNNGQVIVTLSILGKETRVMGTIAVGEDNIEFISPDPKKSVMEQVHGGPLKIPNEFALMKDLVLKVDKVEMRDGFLKVFASSE